MSTGFSLALWAPVVMRHAALRLAQGAVSPQSPANPCHSAQAQTRHRAHPSRAFTVRRVQAMPSIPSCFLRSPAFSLDHSANATKMAAAREFPAFAFLADRRMRRAVSTVSDGQQSRPQVLCGVWADACPHVPTVRLCQRARRPLLWRLWSGALAYRINI